MEKRQDSQKKWRKEGMEVTLRGREERSTVLTFKKKKKKNTRSSTNVLGDKIGLSHVLG